MNSEETVRQLIQQAMNEDSWKQANAPFGTKIDEFKPDNVIKPSSETEKVKTLVPFKTDTFLDTMFLDSEDKPVGLPYGSNSLLTGLPNSGKSIFLEELALKVAGSGRKICYTTSEEVWKTESPRMDLESRMKEKAKLLGLSWETICQNLFVLDAVTHADLRDWHSYVASYRKLVEQEKIEFLGIDSITMLEDSRGQLKYRLSEISKYNQLHGVTSIMINQRSVEECDNLAMAGGISLSHVVDIVMVLDYKKASSWDSILKLDTGCKQSETVNFFRILKCRMCRFDAHYFAYQITKDGILQLLPKPIKTDE